MSHSAASHVEDDISSTVPAAPDEHQIRHSRREKLYFFWEPDNWGLWCSPNATFLRKPMHNPKVDNDYGTMRDYFRRPRKTRWLDSMQPYLAFWPLHASWTGPFACLNVMPGNVPVDKWRHGRGWLLRTDISLAWERLEAQLVKLATALLRRHVVAKYEWSEIRVSTLPYECGYGRVHNSAEDAGRSAIASRNAFVCLSCFVSFTIALDLAVYPLEPGTTPAWLAFAETELKMDPVWLNELNESFVCNFTPGFRPGAYVHCRAVTYKQCFKAFKVANAPLYICWGYRPPWLAPDDLAWQYRPCRAEAKRAIDTYCNRLAPADDPRPTTIAFWYNMGAPIPGDLPNMPPPDFPSRDSTPMPVYEGPTIVSEDSPESPPPHLQGVVFDEAGDPEKDGPQVLLARLAKERTEAMQYETAHEAQRRREDESRAETERWNTGCTRPSVGESMYVWVEDGRKG